MPNSSLPAFTIPKAVHTPCTPAKDALFGPGVSCSHFDFTLFFEQSILGIGISSLFLILFLLRLGQLRGKSVKANRSWVHVVKFVISLAILAVQTALLAFWVKNRITRASVPAAAIEFVSAVAVVFLVAFEHQRIVHPSSLLSIYLLASVVSTAAQTRTLFIRGYVPVISRLTAASLACNLALLVVESTNKKRYLKPADHEFGPEELAGIFSRSVFWWLTPILFLGNRKILKLADLYPLDRNLRSKPLQERIVIAWEKHKSPSPYSFVTASFVCFRWQVLRTIPARLAITGFTYSQTFLINAAIRYLETPAPFRNINHAYGLIAATALIYIGIAIATATYYQKLYKVTSQFRGTTASLLYAQALIKQAGYNELAPVTLMSTDVDRMTMSLTRVMELWAQFIEVSLGVWLLWRQIGAIAVAPLIITLLCFIVQSWASSFMGARQARWVRAVQRRVGIASTVLRQMKSIKLSGLVEGMGELVQSERVRELYMAKQFRGLSVWVNTLSNAPTTFSALVAFAAYSIKAKINHTPGLTTAQAFTSFAILALLTSPASQLLSAIPMITSGMGCVRRIHAFLMSEPFDDFRDVRGGTHIYHPVERDEKSETLEKDVERSSQGSEVPVISVSNVILKPTEHPEKSSISFEAGRGSLTTILGPVGCGKSTFLKALLGELKPESGTISVSTPFIGYCSQSPWLPNERVRDAILGANELDEEWYEKIIEVCQLKTDFTQMPKDDLTIMGSRGIVLSGGQKHRVALARALYARCSILVFDDLLGALDRKTKHAIIERLFGKDGHVERYGLTVVLATHTTEYVHLSENILEMGPGGTVEYIGPPEEWPNRNKDFSAADNINEENKEQPKGVKPKGPAGQRGLMMAMAAKALAAPQDTKETTNRQSGDWGVWLYYGKTIGFFPVLLAVFFVCVSTFTSNFPKLWLQWNTGTSTPAVPLFVGIYFLVSILSLGAQGGMLYQFLMIIGPKSGIRLHDILVKSAFAAPMSYFESMDTSILLNRFSQDMTLIDMQLPMSTFGCIISGFMCLMNLILICLGSTYIAATVPLTVVVLYFIQRFYLRTSRQMRLLDLEHKSPLYRQFTETIEGLETIRAFGWQAFSDDIALEKLNTSQRPYYLLYMIQRWLNFTLDSLVCSLATLLVALALCLPSSSSGGAIGVALSSVLSFNTGLKMLIMTWTQAETSLGSVARTKSFEENTPSEDSPDDNLVPDANWPTGNVEVTKMSLTYGDGTVALRNVSFDIKAGQKFGICGRTGSGKSTLLSSLLRLVDPSSGTILIDGLDISKIQRNIVRDRLICLAQDPLIFPGTFRFNLDPASRISSNDILVNVLKRVNLWTMIEKRGGLEADLKVDSLSHGEQQLLALARAIVRKQIASDRCILVLDEATSNLDKGTETVIQEIIKQEFRDNTVITVAHRLETVREADEILLLEKGEVVKQGPPSEVL